MLGGNASGIVREDDSALPDIGEWLDVLTDEVSTFFSHPENEPLITNNPALAPHWENMSVKDNPDAREAIFSAYFDLLGPMTVWQRSQNSTFSRACLVAPYVIGHWREDEGPLPWLHLARSLADVALLHANVNPSLMVRGGPGDVLIETIVERTRHMLPSIDDQDWETHARQNMFFERAVRIFLKAALATVHHAGPIRPAVLEALVEGVLEPMLEAFGHDEAAPGEDDSQRPSLILLTDSLFGAIAAVALDRIRAHPAPFDSGSIAAIGAVKAVSKAVFLEAADPRMRSIMSDVLMARVYSTVLDLAIDRPELFENKKGIPSAAIAASLIEDIGEALAVTEDPFHSGLLTDLVLSGLREVACRAPAQVNSSTSLPWPRVAAQAGARVLIGLADGYEGRENDFMRLFSREQAVELGEIFLRRAAVTAEMIIKPRLTGEVRAVAGGIARGMAADERALLAAEQWLGLTHDILSLVAANPCKLFASGPIDPDEQFGTKVLKAVLEPSSRLFSGRDGTSLAFGPALSDAILIALKAAIRMGPDIEPRLPQVGVVIERANLLADRTACDQGWLKLYETLLVQALSGDDISGIDDSTVLKIASNGHGALVH
ncbi:MAG: hypothetical protein ACE363_06535 [Alphaproteobacteria bacterium]